MSLPVCTIVGYGPGNGQGIARAFGRAGFSLGLLARSPAKLAGPLAELRAAGHTAELIAADAGDQASLLAGLGTIRDRLGEAEVLVYNAVAFRMAPPTAITADDLVADFRTNVAGALVAANFVVPAMKARRSGAVLFTGGGWALYPSAAVASTAIGKTGLRHLALMLAEELQGSGVRSGTITVMGQVAEGTAFDPDLIGAAFVEAYRKPLDQFEPEIQFRGA
jgi:NADP-dependent 3-hydroxy acid dehydrogenase YdfG